METNMKWTILAVVAAGVVAGPAAASPCGERIAALEKRFDATGNSAEAAKPDGPADHWRSITPPADGRLGFDGGKIGGFAGIRTRGQVSGDDRAGPRRRQFQRRQGM
jgi:hypothetical protein